MSVFVCITLENIIAANSYRRSLQCDHNAKKNNGNLKVCAANNRLAALLLPRLSISSSKREVYNNVHLY